MLRSLLVTLCATSVHTDLYLGRMKDTGQPIMIRTGPAISAENDKLTGHFRSLLDEKLSGQRERSLAKQSKVKVSTKQSFKYNQSKQNDIKSSDINTHEKHLEGKTSRITRPFRKGNSKQEENVISNINLLKRKGSSLSSTSSQLNRIRTEGRNSLTMENANKGKDSKFHYESAKIPSQRKRNDIGSSNNDEGSNFSKVMSQEGSNYNNKAIDIESSSSQGDDNLHLPDRKSLEPNTQIRQGQHVYFESSKKSSMIGSPNAAEVLGNELATTEKKVIENEKKDTLNTDSDYEEYDGYSLNVINKANSPSSTAKAESLTSTSNRNLGKSSVSITSSSSLMMKNESTAMLDSNRTFNNSAYVPENMNQIDESSTDDGSQEMSRSVNAETKDKDLNSSSTRESSHDILVLPIAQPQVNTSRKPYVGNNEVDKNSRINKKLSFEDVQSMEDDISDSKPLHSTSEPSRSASVQNNDDSYAWDSVETSDSKANHFVHSSDEEEDIDRSDDKSSEHERGEDGAQGQQALGKGREVLVDTDVVGFDLDHKMDEESSSNDEFYDGGISRDYTEDAYDANAKEKKGFHSNTTNSNRSNVAENKTSHPKNNASLDAVKNGPNNVTEAAKEVSGESQSLTNVSLADSDLEIDFQTQQSTEVEIFTPYYMDIKDPDNNTTNKTNEDGHNTVTKKV